MLEKQFQEFQSALIMRGHAGEGEVSDWLTDCHRLSDFVFFV